MTWVRLWQGMPNDPKWRVIARKSGQSIGNVIAMFNILMLQGGENRANATERGRTHANDDDDIAAALDIEPEAVAAIRAAMQGKVLDGDRITGWDNRQPKREDENSANRAKAWRESKKAEAAAADGESANGAERNRTQPNARKRPDTDSDTDSEEVSPNGDKARAPRKAKARVEKPDDVDDGVWADFVRHRADVKAPVTDTALAGIRKEAAKAGWSLTDALAECCSRGWRGFKAEWVTDNGNGRNNNGSGNGRRSGWTEPALV